MAPKVHRAFFSSGWLTAALPMTLLASPAELGAAQERVLRVEPAAVQQLRTVPARARREAMSAHPECTAAQMGARNPAAYICQIHALEVASSKISIPPRMEPARNRPLRRRAELAAAAERLGSAVAAYTPVNPIPGLAEQRFRARALGCRPLVALYDQLVAMPAGSPAASALGGIEGVSRSPMKDHICACLADSSRLADGAFLRPGDPLAAEARHAQVRRGCFLDVEAGSTTLLELRRDSPSSAPARVAGGSDPTRADQIRRNAANRDFQLDRCRERHGQRGSRGLHRDKLEACVCEVAQRWRFPKREGSTDEVRLPLLPNRAAYLLQVDPEGHVAGCRVELLPGGVGRPAR